MNRGYGMRTSPIRSNPSEGGRRLKLLGKGKLFMICGLKTLCVFGDMTSFVCDFRDTKNGLALYITIRSDSNPGGETLCLARWEAETLADLPVDAMDILLDDSGQANSEHGIDFRPGCKRMTALLAESSGD